MIDDANSKLLKRFIKDTNGLSVQVIDGIENIILYFRSLLDQQHDISCYTMTGQEIILDKLENIDIESNKLVFNISLLSDQSIDSENLLDLDCLISSRSNSITLCQFSNITINTDEKYLLLIVNIPDRLLFLQRRGEFRVGIPDKDTCYCDFDDISLLSKCKILNISRSGVAIEILANHADHFILNQEYSLNLKIPQNNAFKMLVFIRSISDPYIKDNNSYIKLGCEFNDKTIGLARSAISRYVLKIEYYNARINK